MAELPRVSIPALQKRRLACVICVAMEIQLTTPALLFPAISLLLLAYTNRFLALASIVRALYSSYKSSPDPIYIAQIHNLQRRIRLIRDMQLLGVSSFLLCTVCMFVLFQGWLRAGQAIFGASLLLMMLSLFVSLWEIFISIGALDLQLQNLEKDCQNSAITDQKEKSL